MKYLNKKFILAVGCLALTACSDMDDMTPDSGSMTEAQLEMTTTAIPKRANADLTGIYTYAGEMAAALNSGSIHCDYGYPSLCTAMDANASDFVGDNSNYNWFTPAFDYTDRDPELHHPVHALQVCLYAD